MFLDLVHVRSTWVWLVVGSVAFIPALAFAGEHDGEWWSTVSFSKKLEEFGFPKDTRLLLEYVNKKDRDLERVFQEERTIGLQFPLPCLEGWTLAPNYRHLEFPDTPDEERYFFDLEHTWKHICASEWDLKFRMRLDIRDVDERDDIQYRARPLLEASHGLPLYFRNQPIQFYTSAEAYCDFEADRWNRYRLGGGLKIPLSEHASIKVGYLVESNRLEGEDAWDYDSVLTTKLGLVY